jgi:hypothetical protein
VLLMPECLKRSSASSDIPSKVSAYLRSSLLYLLARADLDKITILSLSESSNEVRTPEITGVEPACNVAR